MTRKILDDAHLHPAIRERVAKNHADIVAEVQGAVAANRVVVVGMRGNPFPKKARKLLDAQGTPHTYLEYGSYFSMWRRRTALKMWSGWPTLPMIFVDGVLIGGYSDLERLVESGEFKAMLAPRLPA